MCELASMWVMPKHRVVWSENTDSHIEIKEEFGLRDVDARGEINAVPIEITPPNGDLSKPLDGWEYREDHAGYRRDLPEWYDRKKAEAAVRKALLEWAEAKLTGWRVREAFHPFHPFKKNKRTLKKTEIKRLVADWSRVCASVRPSVGASIWHGFGASIGASVCASVWHGFGASIGASVCASVCASIWPSFWDCASVRASVGASVWGYTGSLFPNITEWTHAESFGAMPWKSIRKLWRNGYVPSFDGKAWRVHVGTGSGTKSKVLYTWTKEEIEALQGLSVRSDTTKGGHNGLR